MVYELREFPHIREDLRLDPWHFVETEQTLEILYRHIYNLLKFVSATYLDLNWLINNKQLVERRYTNALKKYPLQAPLSPVSFRGPGLSRTVWSGVTPERAAPPQLAIQQPEPDDAASPPRASMVEIAMETLQGQGTQGDVGMGASGSEPESFPSLAQLAGLPQEASPPRALATPQPRQDLRGLCADRHRCGISCIARRTLRVMPRRLRR
jgi:hypothetical protein